MNVCASQEINNRVVRNYIVPQPFVSFSSLTSQKNIRQYKETKRDGKTNVKNNELGVIRLMTKVFTIFYYLIEL